MRLSTPTRFSSLEVDNLVFRNLVVRMMTHVVHAGGLSGFVDVCKRRTRLTPVML